MNIRKFAATAPFAHLLGMTAHAARAEDDDSKQREGESDEDYAKRMEDPADDDSEQRDGESDEDYAQRMEEKEKSGKAKKAKGKTASDLDDDEDGDQDQGDDKEKAARRSERARCAAIFKSPAAAARPDMAAYLAFNTIMKPKAAVGMLETFASGAAKPVSLLSRMAETKIPNVGAGGGKPLGSTASSVAAMIINAGKKARGEV